jgi:DNA-directed RNA polymerase specialized sigma24 family protein
VQYRDPPSTVDLILAEEARLRLLARRFAESDAAADALAEDTLALAYRDRDRFVPGTDMRRWTSRLLVREYFASRSRASGRSPSFRPQAPVENARAAPRGRLLQFPVRGGAAAP